MLSEIPVAGRTRWALYDSDAEVFYVNISDPPQIVMFQSDWVTNVIIDVQWRRELGALPLPAGERVGVRGSEIRNSRD